MASDVFFDNPPVLQGTERMQLDQMYRYLNAMSDKLNQALMTITIEQMAPETQEMIRTAAQKEEEKDAGGYQALKSLIVKTAEVVRHEMTEISTTLTDEYTALSSQFGEYERNLDATITATAEGILQQYNYDERITGLEDDTAAYQRRFGQYIFTGLVDEVGGKYGIAIGENVTAYDEDGNPYLNTERKTATFTMDELAFWHGETKMAWFTDNIFHIAQGEVTKSMKMGNHTWQVLSDGSMGLIAG